MKNGFYAIIGRCTGLIIGVSSYDGIKNVIEEEGEDIKFIPISREEFDSYSDEDTGWSCETSAKYQEIIARDKLVAKFNLTMIRG